MIISLHLDSPVRSCVLYQCGGVLFCFKLMRLLYRTSVYHANLTILCLMLVS